LYVFKNIEHLFNMNTRFAMY